MNTFYLEDEFINYIKELIDNEYLEGAALGVAKLFIAKGEMALSPKQKYIFDNDVVKENSYTRCNRCCEEIIWDEMLDALGNGGYCNYCWHLKEKEGI